ncbi:MAG: PD40 domain-containing protein [Planctomycetes bacterium]|nr:PD40 domain-containing protein [Planctomycetota bacterium]
MSISTAGAESDGHSALGSPNVNRNFLSADGRIVAFFSSASNLVPNDTNGVSDIFVRNRDGGTTTRVSVDSTGVQGNGASSDPAVSADGRYIVFASVSSNLVAGDTNGKIDIFLHDRTLGTTGRLSTDSNGLQGNGDCGRPDISADARFVVFHSLSSNLAPQDTNSTQDVFVKDRLTGITNCLSIDGSGVCGNAFSGNPAISAGGRYVAFHSAATNLVTGDTNGAVDVFVRDRGTFTTTRVSTSTQDDEGDFASQTPSISADGRYVAFSSAATNLVPADTNNLFDVFRKDRVSGETVRASVNSSLVQGNSVSQNGSISADGRFIAFISSATNLVPNDTNGGVFNLNTDIFVRDMIFKQTSRLSVDSNGVEGDLGGSSYNACIAADASTVAFYSAATNLAPGDTNGFTDVFVRGCGGPPSPTTYCWGDGSFTACPCGNAGQSERGCQNSFLTGGGFIAGSGTSRVSNDTFTIGLSGLPPSAAVLIFQGDQQFAGGAGTPFGDGLLCVSGAVVRLGVRFCVGGATNLGVGAGDTPLSITGLIPTGTVAIRFYQGWYRDVATYCTSDLYNLTSGLIVTWTP